MTLDRAPGSTQAPGAFRSWLPAPRRYPTPDAGLPGGPRGAKSLRLPIAAKLALAIELPLIVLFTLAVIWNFSTLKNRSLRDNERWISAQVEAEAARFDALFRELAALVDATAATLTDRVEITESDAHTVVRGLVRRHPEAYGSCLAFKPGVVAGKPGLFAPYAYRPGSGLAEMDVAGAYDYSDGNWEWYTAPSTTLRSVWTEPFLDEGAGDILMCTYAAPVFSPDGSFRAVLTVDVPLERLQSFAGARNSADAAFVIATAKGTLVSSPDPESIGKNVYTDMGLADSSSARDAVDRMLAGETGVSLVSDFPAPGSHFVASAPIPSTGWRLGASVSESRVMNPVYAELGQMVVTRVATIAVVLLGILGLSIWLARPVKRLHAAVQRIAAGDLDARAEGVRSRDELGDLARSFNGMAAQLRLQVEALAKEMAAREAVESELQVARQIQSSLLPRSFPDTEQFALAGFNAPARYVAGDFYDNILEPASGSVLFTIADVSGKGMPAAMMMAVTRTIFRNLAGNGAATDRIVTAANATLSADDSSGMFVTLVLARYDPSSGSLDYCNAGHPRPACVRVDGAVALVGEITGTVVGAIPEARFVAARLELAPGERLVFYTDGVTEARGPDGAFFGERGLITLLERCGREPLDRLCEAISEELDRFQDGKRADDVTLLILERRT